MELQPKRTIAATGGLELARYSTRGMVEIESATAEYADRIGKAFGHGADRRAVDVTIKIQHDAVKASVKAGPSDDPGRGLSHAPDIAHLMRAGWFRAAHIKTEECYRTQLLLRHRRNLKAEFLDLENAIRQPVQTRNDGMHALSPVAVPVEGRLDRARMSAMPVSCIRQPKCTAMVKALASDRFRSRRR